MTALRTARLALLVLLAPLLLTGPVAAQAPAPDAGRLAAARELMKVTGADKQIEGMIQAMGQGLRQGAMQSPNAPGAKQFTQGFEAFMSRFLSYREPMLQEIAGLYAQRFTAEELAVVTEFYRSGPGAKFVAVMPELMQQGAQVGIKYSQKVMQEMNIGPTGR